MIFEKNQSIELRIDSISSDGNGVGRLDGRVVFVPFSAPGDLLRVKIVKIARNHAYGRIEELLSPGPGRLPGPDDCPISHVCGGCALRHITYGQELEAKHGFVAQALEKIGGLHCKVLPPIFTGEVERYRNKAQYPVAAGPNGGLEYGFFARRSHRVVPCNDCLLQPKLVNQIAAFAVKLLAESGATAYDEATRTGLLRHICLRYGFASGEVLVCLVATSPALPRRREFCERLAAAFPQIKGIVLNLNERDTNVIFGDETHVLWGVPEISDAVCGVPLTLNATAFSQVNPRAAAKLFSVVHEFAAPTPDAVILDLYCGTGVIGLSMAGACKALVGVEIDPGAIESAKASARQMGAQNTRFLQGDATQASVALAKEGLSPDVVILDPPRKGAGETTLREVLAFGAPRVVMVSCNPATLARDLRFLFENGYDIMKVQPVDLFPRTTHVETACLLQKRE